MNIYPTSSTSQSPLSLKTNWTFKIAIQINNQKEWVEKSFWIKAAPKQGKKVHSVPVQSIAVTVQSIAHSVIFKKIVWNASVQSIALQCKSIAHCYSSKNGILKGQFLVQTFHQTPYDHRSNWARKFHQIMRK